MARWGTGWKYDTIIMFLTHKIARSLSRIASIMLMFKSPALISRGTKKTTEHYESNISLEFERLLTFLHSAL